MTGIKVEDISSVRFRAPDLDEMRAFLEEFGFVCFTHNGRLYGRGTDGAPYLHVTELGDPAFLGLGFRAQSRADLETLAARDGAAVDVSDEPGGGYRLHLRDPDGNLVEVIAEQTWGPASAVAPEAPINSATGRRRVHVPVRIEPGPSHVHRLGHVVLNITNFAASQAWYKERFGLVTSDQIEIEPGVPLGAFLRCDRGDIPTDHHTLFLAQTPDGPGFNHAAFEVSGFYDLMKGHWFLKSRNRDHAWGIGRHIVGSQVFDYWKDPWGHEIEHWTDGDLCTAADPPGVASLADLLGTQWGPHFPAAPEGV
jgi:catechol 2,3-dioxygenase-like lactoylglutathione lyase family enzyme